MILFIILIKSNTGGFMNKFVIHDIFGRTEEGLLIFMVYVSCSGISSLTYSICRY
jgi:hypothetical protein